MTTFQLFLRDYFRQPRAMSQRQLAKEAGVSHVFLNRVIQGHSVPSLTIAEKIANATGASLGKVLSKSEKSLTIA